MFECKYKYELEDCLTSAIYVYKSQKRNQDKVIAILIPILMLAMVAMLIVDIVTGNSYVLDIVLLVALVILEIVYLLIPVTLKRSQKKAYFSQNLDKMDYLDIVIDNALCTETLIKDESEQAKNVHSLKSLTSFLEDSTRLILVFNRAEYVCIRKDKLMGGLDKLKAHLQKCMSKNINGKK